MAVATAAERKSRILSLHSPLNICGGTLNSCKKRALFIDACQILSQISTKLKTEQGQ